MEKKTISGILIFALLVFSLVSSIYLILNQRIKQKEISIKSISTVTSPSIGVVEVFGQIYSPSQQRGIISPAGMSKIIEDLKEFRKDDKIKAVIIRVNSPGGTIGAVQEITREVYRFKKTGKPIVASISDICASGGYYIASGCDRIVANSGSIVGSIGAIFMSTDFSELMKKIGMDVNTIKSGPYKDAGSFHRPLKEEEEEFLQDLIDDVYNQFVVAVSSGRNIPVNQVKEVAKGQVYSGLKAKELKLVDKIGDFTIAKQMAEKMAGIKEAKIIRRPHGRFRRFFNLLNKSILPIDLFNKKSTGLSYIYKP
ncbi:MAG: signal peptide peptidase SppA [Elusimicrobiota bacterium]